MRQWLQIRLTLGLTFMGLPLLVTISDASTSQIVGAHFYYHPVLGKYADIVLSTSSTETEYNILALNSRIAQLTIIDALYFYVVYNQSHKALQSIKETEHSLLSKKY